MRPQGEPLAPPADAPSPRPQEPFSPLDALRSIPAAIATAAAFEAGSRAIFGSAGWSEVLVPIASAIGLLIASIHVVFSKTLVPSTLDPGLRHKEFRYSTTLRWIGKVGLSSMLVLLPLRLWDLRPNFLFGEAAVSGFLCSMDSGNAVTEGSIQILGRNGSPVSAAERLDDRGYFYLDLDRFAFRPVAIRFESTGSSSPCLIPLETARQGACAASSEAPSWIKPAAKEWVSTCKK